MQRETPEQLSARNARIMGKLPAIRAAIAGVRAQVEKDLESTDARIVASAIAVRLMDKTTMRVGSRRYAQPHGKKAEASFGASSLRSEHVAISGAAVTLSFRGKSGVLWHREISDAKLATALAITVPGDVIDETDVRTYLAPFGITPKNFRTFHATELAASLFAEAGRDPKAIPTIVKAVAAHLGNTPAICKSSYIDPQVWA